MKKKIMAMCLVIAMAATAVIGGTLAYFTDKDSQTNVFTAGNVAIDLYEDFDESLAHLMPVTYNADGTRNEANVVNKDVYVENTGSDDAFVRVHIAIPTILDDGAETFDASANILHFNYEKDSVGEGKWDWSKAADDDKYEGNWNFYTTTINNISYNVYVVTHEAALKSGDVTVGAMSQVYLDKEVTNDDVTELKETLGNEWKILVAAEGAQKAGFEDAHTALNTAFGIPGAYEIDWTTVSGKTTVAAE